jgi:hypothetical protein
MRKLSKAEGIRRARLGDLRRLLRARWGSTLPDDCAGHSDLQELLTPISLGEHAKERMKAACETWAPWLPEADAWDLIHTMLDLPRQDRKPKPKELGLRLRLTNAERERHRLWTIRPFDMTAQQLRDQRKRKDRQRKRLKRKSRDKYLEEVTAPKPWTALGISRATYYRRRETGCVRRPNSTSETGCARTTKSVRQGASEAKYISAVDGPSLTPHCNRVNGSRKEQEERSQDEARMDPVSEWPELPAFLNRRCKKC